MNQKPPAGGFRLSKSGEKGEENVIVQETETGFILIRQHDHGQISGDFADHWVDGGRPGPSLRTAVRYHDVGWEELDGEVRRLHPKTGKPYSFVDFPMAEKLTAYRHGIDRVEAMDSYAGCLCSIHYASFFKGTSDPLELRFLEEEKRRRERLKERMTERERETLEKDWDFLRLCDDLSLFVCLNPPGRNVHPWYQEGIRYQEGKLLPEWEDEGTLRMKEGLIRGSFTIRIPFCQVDHSGQPEGKGEHRVVVKAG
ncbi:DUF3891 family protein [Salinithrix halophila]|uniref:DUF3891 family protein n=1 Tax=Salinithrix halophila TaxID=1485204 RepID=A0ABV8JJQ6_9BACL